MHKKKLSILLPVRNEGINIGIMIKILFATLDVPSEIIVIYDHDEDDTVPAVKELMRKFDNIKLIRNNLGRGVVNAVKEGVKASEGQYILIFATDDVGPVMAIEDMVALMDEGCDLVSATRYAHGGRRLGGSLIGGVISMLANKLMITFSGSVFTDATTGAKVFKREDFENIALESKPVGWAFILELALKAQEKGLKLGEVPVVSIDRLYGGKSSFLLGPWIKEYLKWFLWGFTHLPLSKRRRKPRVKIPRISTDTKGI